MQLSFHECRFNRVNFPNLNDIISIQRFYLKIGLTRAYTERFNNKSKEEDRRKDIRAGIDRKDRRDGGSALPFFRRAIKTCTVTKMPPMENALLRTASYFKRTGLVAVLYLLFSKPKSLTARSSCVLLVLRIRL